VVLMTEEQILQLQHLLADALYVDEAYHKQWFLWRIAEELGLDLSGEWDENYPKPDEGIAP